MNTDFQDNKYKKQTKKIIKIHKNNNLHIGISNSYGRQKYEFGLFTRPSMIRTMNFQAQLPFYLSLPEVLKKFIFLKYFCKKVPEIYPKIPR